MEADVRRVPEGARGAPFDLVARLRRVRRRQAALRRRARLPGLARDRAVRTTRSSALGRRQERDRPAADPRRGRRGLRGLGALPARRARRRPAPRGRLLEPQLPRRARGRRHRGPARGAHRRRASPRSATCAGKPAPDTFLAARARARASRRSRPPSSRTRWPASRRAAPAASATWSASTARASATRCASTAPTSWSTTSPTCCDHPAAFAVEPWAVTEERARPRRARPGRVGLRAVQRAHRPARQPRRGRAVRAARHLPQRASTRRARCPTRRPATAIRRTARPSSTSPTASSSGCSSTTSRSTCATASCSSTRARSTCARACCAARSHWRSPAGREVKVRSMRLVSFVQRSVAGDPLRGRAAGRRDARSSCSQSSSPTSRSRRRATIRAPRRRWRAPLVRRAARAPRPARRAGAPHARAAGCGWRRGWTTWSAGPQGTVTDGRAARRPRPRHRQRRGRPTARRSCSPSSSPTAGRASARCRRSATRSTPRSPPPCARAGTGCSTSSAPTSTTSGIGADVEIDGDDELQQAVRFALFHTLQAGARAEQRAIPAKGLTGPGLRRARRSGTPRPSSCRC